LKLSLGISPFPRLQQNPHIKKVVPGIVIDLLDDDPKEMWKKRERGQRRQANMIKVSQFFMILCLGS
jgi:hypothetical protein